MNTKVVEHGGTPLHAASFSGQAQVVALLLYFGAEEVGNKTGNNLTPNPEDPKLKHPNHDEFRINHNSNSKSYPNLNSFRFSNSIQILI